MDWTSKKKKNLGKAHKHAVWQTDKQVGREIDRWMKRWKERLVDTKKQRPHQKQMEERKEGVKDTTNRQLEDQIDTHHFAAPS